MDTITHALSGALLARATEPEAPRPDQLPRRARMWVGFLAAAFPDSDFALLFLNPLTYLTTHRGLTHSIVLLPLWAALLALTFMLLMRRKYPWRAFVGVCALGIGIHIAGDVIPAFGTMIFAPLSDWRAQLPTTFIIDPYFTAIIVAGLIASANWKMPRVPAVIGLAVLAVYVGFQGTLYNRATAAGRAYVLEHGLKDAQVEAVPQPFSPFHWMVVVIEPGGYRLSYISLVRRRIPAPPAADAYWFQRIFAAYRPSRDADWSKVPRFGPAAGAAVAEAAWGSRGLAPYRRFAPLPAVHRVGRRRAPPRVWFQDLRFALPGRTPPFRYGACRDAADAAWRVHRLIVLDDGREIPDPVQ